LAETVAIVDEFNPVSERVGCVKSPAARQDLVPHHRKSGRRESLRQFVETQDAKRGMRLPLGREVLFYPQVHDGPSAAEPASSAPCERPGLGILPHPDQVLKE